MFLNPKKWIREEFNQMVNWSRGYEYDYLSKVLTDETIYQYDLNGDGSIGAVIEATYNGKSNSESYYKINTGDFILGTNGTEVGRLLNNKSCYIKIINLLNLAMNLRRSMSFLMMLQVKVFSGSDDSWIVDKFSNYGEFQSSENYNLAQILHEETISQLDFNYDNHRGNKVEERYEMKITIIKIKVCIRMKLVVLQYQISGIKRIHI